MSTGQVHFKKGMVQTSVISALPSFEPCLKKPQVEISLLLGILAPLAIHFDLNLAVKLQLTSSLGVS
jgi:hypothetical protein